MWSDAHVGVCSGVLCDIRNPSIYITGPRAVQKALCYLGI